MKQQEMIWGDPHLSGALAVTAWSLEQSSIAGQQLDDAPLLHQVKGDAHWFSMWSLKITIAIAVATLVLHQNHA